MITNEKVNKIIAEVVDKLKAEYQPEKIILYGSYAYGQPNEDSDIDLFIIKDTNKRRVDRFVEVSEITYNPKRPISIQPVIYTPKEVEERLSIRDGFIEEILAKGEVLYAR